MIGGAIARVARGRGGGGRAEDRNRASDGARGARSERADSLLMDVAVQDRLGAEIAHDALERGRVRKAAQRRRDSRRGADGE